MAAPAFVSEAETTWTISGAAKTTASISAQAADVIVAVGISEDNSVPFSATPVSSTPTETWTQRQNSNLANYVDEIGYTATVTSTGGITVTFTPNSATTRRFGGNALAFRGSDGVGASNINNATSGAGQVGLTTLQDNSAVVVIIGDWNAVDGAGRTWLSVNGAPSDQSYFRDSTGYTAYVAYYPDVGAAGAKTVGLSGPTGMQFQAIAVEVRGTAGAVATPPVLVMAPRIPSY